MKRVLINGNDLTLEQLYEVVFAGATVAVDPDARERMEASRVVVDRVVSSNTAAYGITTGFGELARVRILPNQILQLQINIVRSHACGVGEPFTESETRALILLRANMLAKGFSGVRPIIVETLCAMLNRGVHPLIPSQGSVGAGDLAPHAHLTQVAIGEGEAIFQGKKMAGGEALRAAGITPLRLEAKEGLALVSGTQGMLALLALTQRSAEIVVDSADVAAALSLDASRATPAVFDERISRVRPFPGQARTARNLVRLNHGSEIRESHSSPEKDLRVQDACSMRCTPQVHGAVRDALARVGETITIELNSVSDNPLVFADSGEVLSCGNFDGQQLAMAADQMAVALATLAGIAERRIEHMTNPHTSLLPPFLIQESGLNSGFMIAQVTAAALASELKALATPHSVDSISTSGNQEDYVAMGMSGARRLRPMLDNVRNIVAIEFLAACQGIDLLAPLHTGTESQKAYDLVRSVSKRVDVDRSLAPDIAAVGALISTGAFQELLSQNI